MSTPIQSVTALAQTLLSSKVADGTAITREIIAATVDQVCGLDPRWQVPGLSDEVVRDLEARFHVWIGESRSLSDDTDHVQWLLARRGEIKWSYWSRYRVYLQQTIADASIEALEDATDDTLGRLEDPLREGHWSRRGLVVGHVQSGKTANYIGLICKAADAGYKLIVVLAGMHKNLRSQTQVRLDEGFLGYRSDLLRVGGSLRPIGVGLIDPSLRPDSITSRSDDGDFKRTVAASFAINPGGNPLLFVVKKNGSVLRNLLDWMEWASNSREQATGRRVVARVPLLLIDDEADHGSIDTNEIELDENGVPDPDHDPTVINRSIRKLLHFFEQNAYVGYTATPFANIYIHEKASTSDCGDDLFPRSFITSLPAPSNHVGPLELFGLSDDPEVPNFRATSVIQHITDFIAPKEAGPQATNWMPPVHKKTHVPKYDGLDEIPPSLKKALRSFVLGCAARFARGRGRDHKSMLVHVTRFTDVQHWVARQVSSELADMKSRWRNEQGSGRKTLRGQLRELWDGEFAATTELLALPDCPAAPWDDIEPRVWDALSSIVVKEINGSAKDVLDYDEYTDRGLNVVAIGGDKLSRGLTLAGLMVSYFLRASKMYDTLMQMGRWFGYRPGYLDLCRLFVTRELEDWYRHIAAASEELRAEFDHMVAIGGTPRDYGLKVKSHPVLLVTSAVKSRTGVELQLSFAGDVAETVAFYRDKRLADNFTAFAKLIEMCGPPTQVSPKRDRPGGGQERWDNGYLWNSIPYQTVVSFLRDSTTHTAARRVNRDLLLQFIGKQVSIGELLEWTVAVVAGDGGDSQVGSLPLKLVKRKAEEAPDDRYSIGRLVSPKDEGIDLGPEAYERALRATQQAWTKDPGRSKRQTPPASASGPMMRGQRPKTRGLLLIYPLDWRGAEIEWDGADPVPIVGFAISFPASDTAEKVSYKVNNIYYEQEFGGARG